MIFLNLTEISEPTHGLWGQGQGHRDTNFDVHEKVLSQDTCVPNIYKIAMMALNHSPG